MNHQEIDPSLRAAEPALDNLADGFSPPPGTPEAAAPDLAPAEAAQFALPPKSPF